MNVAPVNTHFLNSHMQSKSPEQIIKDYLTMFELEEQFEDDPKQFDWLRSALASIVRWSAEEACPQKPSPNHDDVFEYGRERAIDEFRSTLNALAEEIEKGNE